MSHYTQTEIGEITDEECLVKALEALGFMGKIERHDVASFLYGYHGDRRPQKAHVVIRRQHIGSASNDIGFERQANGTYVAHISEYDQRIGYGDKWVKKVKQAYAAEKILKEAKKKGIRTLKTQKDGKIRIELAIAY